MAKTKVHGEYLDPSVISAQTEVTAVGSDHMLIFDATDNALKKALLSDLIETVGSTPSFTSATISGDLTVDTSTLKVDSSNNRVGIGTASPQKALDIAGVSSSGGAVMRLSGTGEASQGDVTGAIQFYNADTTDNTPGVFGMLRGIAGASGGEGSLQILTDMPSEGADASNVTMHFNSNGNVGIGTTSPKTNFEVIGGLNLSNNTTSATTTTMRIGSYGASSQTYYGAKLVAHTNFTSTANADLSFDLGGLGEVMRLHCAGSETRVGIGTTSPSRQLHLSNSSDHGIMAITGGTSNLAGVVFGDTADDDVSAIIHNNSGNYLYFNTSSTERMRIDSSGNLLVGTTSTGAAAGGSGTSGININANGGIELARSANPVLFVNRTTSDGDIVQLRKDGSTVGSLASISSAYLAVRSNGGNLRLGANNTDYWSIDEYRIYPTTDAVDDIGLSSNRVRNLHLSGGVYLGGSGAANHLDDYEEGTWTPDLRNGTTSLSTQTWAYGPRATYTKIGDLVFIHLSGKLSSVAGTGSSELRIFGLPFTPEATGGFQEYRMNFIIGNQPNTADSYSLFAFVRNNGTDFGTRRLDGGDTVFTSNRIDSDTFFTIFGCYKT